MSRAVIRDLGYQPYEGERQLGSKAWIITWTGLKQAFKSRWAKWIGVLAIIATVAFGVGMYVVLKVQGITGKMGVPMPKVLEKLMVVDRYLGEAIIMCGGFFGFFAAVLVAGPALSDDLKGGGLNFHFTRPVTHIDYMLGKILPTTIAIGVLGLIPAIGLGLMRVAISPEWESVTVPLSTMGKGLLLCGLIALAQSLPAVAMSSLTMRRGIARALWALVYWIPPMVGGALRGITKDPRYMVVSIMGALDSIHAAFFGSKEKTGAHWDLALAVLGAYVLLGFGLIYYRVRRWEKKG